MSHAFEFVPFSIRWGFVLLTPWLADLLALAAACWVGYPTKNQALAADVH
jgi:hypothetical protein